MSISNRVRFEVFKRDKFTCQYCGRAAPDVVLWIDHIQPVSKGGTDGILNLVTSCRDCNSGKRDRLLSDDSTIRRQKQQLDELQERREQLSLLMRWQRELANLDQEVIKELTLLWEDLVPGFTLANQGLEMLKKLLRRYEVAEIAEAMRISANQYLKYKPDNGDGLPEATSESVIKAREYIGRICAARRRNKGKPYMERLYYIRGILRNRHRLSRRQEWECIKLMEKNVLNNVSIEEIERLAKETGSYRDFEDHMTGVYDFSDPPEGWWEELNARVKGAMSGQEAV